MKEFSVIIPAVKKNVAFPDDLIKKLAGKTLIQRAIDKAKNISHDHNIYVLTDSKEICLICEMNQVRCVYDKNIKLRGLDFASEIGEYFSRIEGLSSDIVILWPYVPLLDENEIIRAYKKYKADNCDLVVAIKMEKHRLYKADRESLQSLIANPASSQLFISLRAFAILKANILTSAGPVLRKTEPYVLNDEVIEINNHQDWWICEKLFQRKRIVFRVIGNEQVGMGHVYRALSLAHEISDHEVIFSCDEESKVAVDKIAGSDYLVETTNKGEILDKILSLRPDMVINDMLDTAKPYIARLKRENIRVVNFEDMGQGNKHADLVINELYDKPDQALSHVKWGDRYYFLRDEFEYVEPNDFLDYVNSILIIFGGTDPNNLTLKVLKTVIGYCRDKSIHVYVVTGSGYVHKQLLDEYISQVGSKNLEFTCATSVISSIMAKTQIAISSNGRTPYELAHMNVPSIILSQHAREATHGISTFENGFINLGVYNEELLEGRLMDSLRSLVENKKLRRSLFDNMQKHDFSSNKRKVVDMIMDLLDKNDQQVKTNE